MADKTVVVRIVVRANQFSSGLRGAAADVNKFAVDVERGSARAGSSALALGAASATAGKLMLVGIGGALAVSAKAAIDFESSLAGVAKTTDLTGSAFAKAGSPLAAFGEALRSLSMRIPVNANDLAAIAEMGGQLGIEVPNLIEFTEVMAALGVSTNLGAEEAATGLARFTNIMGTEQDQFERLGSVVVDLGNKLAATESEILHFALRLAPTGATVRMTEEEVLGLSAAMSNLGIPAERGGTALQRIFLDMQGAVLGGGEALESWAGALRMSTEEFQALFRESPAQVFAELVKQLDATQDAGGNAAGILSDLGIIEQRSIQVLLAAANGWESVAESLDIANQAGEEGTALQEEAARRYGTTASQIQILSNTFSDLRIEVGNALLGSGGLAAGIDFMREFFRIIKDNLPLLGELVKILATIATIRLGANIVSGFVTGLASVRAMKVGLDGVTASTKALRLASLGLNTAVFAAIAVVGALVTAWGAAAVKAAELKQIARELQEELELGADPVEAMTDKLREQTILTPEVERLLNDLGISVEDFVERIFDGDEALAQLGKNDIDTWFLDLMEVSGKTREELMELFGPDMNLMKGRVDDLSTAIKGSAEILDAFFLMKSNEVTNGLIEAGLGAKYSTDQIRKMADEAVRLASIRATPEDIVKSFTEGTPGRRKPGGTGGRGDLDFAKKVKLSWEEMVLGMEGGADTIDDFWESLAEGMGDYTDSLQDSFDEVREIVMGGFPAWDEYEQVTVESFSKILEAQDLYIEDLKDGFTLQSELAGTTTQAVMAWIESLDPATKGALARWRETNRSEFDTWLGEVEENLGEAEILTGDFWSLKMPGAMQEGFSVMVGTLTTLVQSLNLPGEQAAEAFTAGLMSIMSQLPEDQQDDFRTYMSDLLQDGAFLESLGYQAGDPVVQGILRALSTLAARSYSVIAKQRRDMMQRINEEWDTHSPSRLTEEVGKNITRGLVVGMEDEWDRQMARTRSPVVNVMAPRPQVILQTKVQSGSRDIILNYPQHRSDDVIDGVQKGMILSGLQREAEVAIGPG